MKRYEDPRLQQVLERALETHGIGRIKTYRETFELSGRAPLGMRFPGMRGALWLDRGGASGRTDIYQGKDRAGIYQQTPAGVYLWTTKTGTQKLRDADSPFVFTPMFKSALLGLLALKHTSDPLTYIEKGAIQKKKGMMIVRTQSVPTETLVAAGRSGLIRESCQTTWAYLFGPDGTLIAEQITQKLPRRTQDIKISYDRFQVIEGIKIPMEMGVRPSDAPSMVSMKIRVRQVLINQPIGASEFQLP
jgi:hypothetical protein